MNDEYDDFEPGRRSGAHRQETAAKSNVGAITLVIVLALVAVLLVVAAINIITSSMTDPESNVAEPGVEQTGEATPTPTESEVSVADASLTVDVLNGSGVSGVAQEFSEAVESEGWTVGTVGNYSTPMSTSTVYYNGEENASQAELVADALGVSSTEQSVNFDSDITVVVCSDIAERGPESKSESGGSGEAGTSPTEGASN